MDWNRHAPPILTNEPDVAASLTGHKEAYALKLGDGFAGPQWARWRQQPA